MRGAVMHAPGDVRVEQREDPAIVDPTDAIIRVSAACICGSDLWPHRGVEEFDGPMPMGHEYVGVVEDVGSDVRSIEPGQFVVGSFFASDNTCEICRAGYHSSCVKSVMGGFRDSVSATAANVHPRNLGTSVVAYASIPAPPSGSKQRSSRVSTNASASWRLLRGGRPA
jgi:threonine dehydrogenase-like Zn-dependent dehydrogenase